MVILITMDISGGQRGIGKELVAQLVVMYLNKVLVLILVGNNGHFEVAFLAF